MHKSGLIAVMRSPTTHQMNSEYPNTHICQEGIAAMVAEACQMLDSRIRNSDDQKKSKAAIQASSTGKANACAMGNSQRRDGLKIASMGASSQG
jgi:hypothetical protein